MKIRAFDIRWDTDGFKTKLPSEMVITVSRGSSENPLELGELDDIVGDVLTAETGWCHFGFEYEILD